MIRSVFLTTLVLSLTPVNGALAQTPDTVEPAHAGLEPGTNTDDLGITIPYPVSHPGRRYPVSDEFPTGPEIGERLPAFSLPNQQGRMVEYHADLDGSKSIVVFYRSAVW